MTRFDLLEQFTDAETGRLERRVLAPPWKLPTRIVVDGDRLRWTLETDTPDSPPHRMIEPAPGLLEQFLRLRDAPASQILRYAQRWGVLGLCEHDFPAQHPPEYWPSRAIEGHVCPYAHDDPWGAGRSRSSRRPPRPAPRSKRPDQRWPAARTDFHICFVRGYSEDGWYVGKPWEPLEAWRTWARRAHAFLAVAAALQQKQVGVEADWRMATDSRMETPRTPADGWRALTYYAGFWLKAADVRPWPQFQDGMVRFAIGSDWGHSPLFGAIAVQLVLAISGTPGFAVCDACRNVYAPLRSPRAGERHYCRTCRANNIPQRYAAARYRKGEASKRRSGPTASESSS